MTRFLWASLPLCKMYDHVLLKSLQLTQAIFRHHNLTQIETFRVVMLFSLGVVYNFFSVAAITRSKYRSLA